MQRLMKIVLCLIAVTVEAGVLLMFGFTNAFLPKPCCLVICCICGALIYYTTAAHPRLRES